MDDRLRCRRRAGAGIVPAHRSATGRKAMAKVSMSTPLGAAAEEVWKLIGGFNALPEWHPAVKASKADAGGRVRELDLGGGAKIVEQLESFDDKQRVYSYSIVSGPLP